MPNSVIDQANTDSAESPPLLVQLPRELDDFFETSGYSGLATTEDRIATRLNARCTAKMQFMPAPLALANEVDNRPAVATVLIKDLSKTGVGILIHCQVYPTERSKVHLHGRDIYVTVHRCRRLGPMCYEVGASVDVVKQS